jgi:hypothetical protein
MTPMRVLVATEVRAWLGRRRMSGAELARRMGKSQTWIARRLDGRQAFDVDDLEHVAHVLGVQVSELLPGGERQPVTHVSSGDERGSVIPFPLDRVAITGGNGGPGGGAYVETQVPRGDASRAGEHDTAA